MMKAIVARLFARFGREDVEREVEEELRFHVDLLTREHVERGMSLEAARDAALKRFGDPDLVRNQCAEISRRSRPVMRVLKSFLILVFLTGVLVRAFNDEPHFRQIGDMLIAIAVLGRLLLYARGLSPSSFPSKNETSSPLMLKAGPRVPLAAYDLRKMTPVERVISDE